MMHDREKSDSAIVASKPTNNVSVSKPDAAEQVEPRAGTNRNTDQQSTHRTQSRAGVSQTLDRVWHTAASAVAVRYSR